MLLCRTRPSLQIRQNHELLNFYATSFTLSRASVKIANALTAAQAAIVLSNFT
jgi:hypothetical protein